MRSLTIRTRYVGPGRYRADGGGHRVTVPITDTASGHETAARRLAGQTGTLTQIWSSEDGGSCRFIARPLTDPLPAGRLENLFIGRQADGSRVYVDIARAREEKPVILTDHSVVGYVDRLTISGSVIAPHGREAHRFGQITDDLAAVTRPAGTLTTQDIADLVAIWDRWHPNDMRAACAHMPDTSTVPDGADVEERYGRPDVVGWHLKHTVCPVTGYRYGTAWLAEVVPADVWRRLAEIVAAAQEARR